jgi:hypothetical protein
VRSTAIAIEIGMTRCSDPADATRRTSMICSVAYATDDNGSEERMGRARILRSVECSACHDGWLRPRRTVLKIAVRDRPGFPLTFATGRDSRRVTAARTARACGGSGGQ